MADERFNTALEDCISRLARGETLAETVRRYPEFEADLRVLLEGGLIVRHLQASDAEVAVSQRRVAERFEAALSARGVRRPHRQWWRSLSLAAAVVAVFLFVNVVLAQQSLPGDWNYGIKRGSESLFLLVADTDEQRERIAERRRDETRSLLASGREAEVTFEGEIIAIDEAGFHIAEFEIQIDAAAALLAELEVSQRVKITVRTTADGRVVARAIEPLRERDPDADNIIISPVPEATATASATLTATTHITATETATSTPTLTESPAPTVTSTPSPEITAIDNATRTPAPPVRPSATGRATRTPVPQVRPSATATIPANDVEDQGPCVVSVPSGWVAYTIQRGDTLSALAALTGGSLERIVRVNCIVDPVLITAGQTIYLPHPVETRATPTRADTEATRPSERPSATQEPGRPGNTPSRGR